MKAALIALFMLSCVVLTDSIRQHNHTLELLEQSSIKLQQCRGK